MKQGKSEIVVLLDRSGSMSTIQKDMEEGLKAFLERQKDEPGECVVSYFKFDGVFETVFEEKPIKSVERLVLEPRGATSLLDAMGKSINSVGNRLRDKPESERPEHVIFVIITDGEENNSREFTKETVFRMVKEQESIYKWNFVYLGANQDAIQEGAKYGINANCSLTFSASSHGVSASTQALNNYVSNIRDGNTNYAFTQEDRTSSL